MVLASRKIDHPDFPAAIVRTPVLLKADPNKESAYLQERFGPISFIVKVPDGGPPWRCRSGPSRNTAR